MSDNPFHRAIEVLRERGWHQGEFAGRGPAGELYAPGTPVCVWGALNLASGAEDAQWCSLESQRLYEFAEQLLALDLGTDTANLVYWNDYGAESQEDVELLLKKAAAAWDSREAAS